MQEIRNEKDGLHIEWIVSDVCNYRCSYCTEDLNGGKQGWPSAVQASSFINKIISSLNGKNVRLTLSGGEPTLWKDLIYFLNMLPPDIQVGISSNASRRLEFWQKLRDESPGVRTFCLSVHPEYANMNHIVDVTEVLHKTHEISIHCIYLPGYLSQLTEFLDELERRELNAVAIVRPIRQHDQNGKLIEYSEEEKAFLNRRYSSYRMQEDIRWPKKTIIDGMDVSHSLLMRNLVAKQRNRFRGWQCDAGTKRVVIWPNGDALPAACHTAKSKVLGNIHSGDFTPIKNLICEDELCVCISDIRIPKRHPDKISEHQI